MHTSPGVHGRPLRVLRRPARGGVGGLPPMLSQVERGAGMDQVHLLRCLVEVGVRAGPLRRGRSTPPARPGPPSEFDLDPHTGWFIAGAGRAGRRRPAPGAGPSRSAASAAAEEAGDTRYLQPHLLAARPGPAALRRGRGRARAALRRIREIEAARGFSDPTVNRWHADLVSAWSLLGRARGGDGDARRGPLRGRAARAPTASAALDRAEAEVLGRTRRRSTAPWSCSTGREAVPRPQHADRLGRTLLVRAHLERRRRRSRPPGRSRAARGVFRLLHADSWADQVARRARPRRARGVAVRDWICSPSPRPASPPRSRRRQQPRDRRARSTSA